MPDGDRDHDHRRRCIGRRRAAGDRQRRSKRGSRSSKPSFAAWSCQNQTLADSNADLASDLRREVREQALAGKNDSEIRDYLVARYGDFVLYDPPLKRTTWLLWFGPFTLLAGGG